MIRRALAAGSVLALALAAGCTSERSDRGADRGAGAPSPAAGAVGSPPPAIPLPELTVVGAHGGRIGAGAPVRVQVTGGRLTGTVTSSPRLPGAVRAGATGWESSGKTRAATAYRLSAEVLDSGGSVRRVSIAVRTSSQAATLDARVTPGDDAVVGVGMPVTVTFDQTVKAADRVTLERRMKVSTRRAITGAWRWMSGSEVHFRPAAYWPAHEPVRVAVDLAGLYLPGGTWGGPSRTTAFTIGKAQTSVADVAAHRFTVYSGGRQVKSYPASMGSAEFPSKGGVHLALEKTPSRMMDSATIGIPRSSPGGYYKRVLWDVRISYGGAFVHSAPWSVGAQGSRNVSHGCINLAPEAARWYYDFVQRGDPVRVVNAVVGPRLTDPGTMDWNLSWESWLEGSATGARSTAA